MASLPDSDVGDYMFRFRTQEEGDAILKEMRCVNCKIIPYPSMRFCSAGHIMCPKCAVESNDCPREVRQDGSKCGKLISSVDQQSAVHNLILYYHYCTVTNTNRVVVPVHPDGGETGIQHVVGDVKCPFPNCAGLTSPADLIAHLEELHSTPLTEGQDVTLEMAWTPYAARVEMITACFGEQFLVLVKESDSRIVLWIVKTSGERQCEDYTVQIALQASPEKQSRQLKLTWEGVPVSSVNACDDDGFQLNRDYLLRKYSRFVDSQDPRTHMSTVSVKIMLQTQDPEPSPVPQTEVEAPVDAPERRLELAQRLRAYRATYFYGRQPRTQFIVTPPILDREGSYDNKERADDHQFIGSATLAVRNEPPHGNSFEASVAVGDNSSEAVEDKRGFISTEPEEQKSDIENLAVVSRPTGEGECVKESCDDDDQSSTSSLSSCFGTASSAESKYPDETSVDKALNDGNGERQGDIISTMVTPASGFDDTSLNSYPVNTIIIRAADADRTAVVMQTSENPDLEVLDFVRHNREGHNVLSSVQDLDFVDYPVDQPRAGEWKTSAELYSGSLYRTLPGETVVIHFQDPAYVAKLIRSGFDFHRLQFNM